MIFFFVLVLVDVIVAGAVVMGGEYPPAVGFQPPGRQWAFFSPGKKPQVNDLF